MAKDQVEAFLFTDLSNIFYLTGFCGSDGALLVTSREAILLVDGRYDVQAKQQAPRCRVVVYAGKVEGVAGELQKKKLRRIGYEPASLTVAVHRALKRAASKVSWIYPSDWHPSFRAIKDLEELRFLRLANRKVDQAFRKMIPKIRIGMPEKEIALALELAMRRAGAEKTSFPISVASGKNASLPHARSEARRIRSGEPIFIDFGGTFKGYQTDQTVTLFWERIPPRWREIYMTVKEAHDLAFAAAMPGMWASDLDAIAREHIAKRGFGECFGHSLGHGVGIDVHEYPSISPRSKARLEAGMVFTIEPGIYIPGKGGVRIEDTVFLTDKGAKCMTSIDKSLRSR